MQETNIQQIQQAGRTPADPADVGSQSLQDTEHLEALAPWVFSALRIVLEKRARQVSAVQLVDHHRYVRPKYHRW